MKIIADTDVLLRFVLADDERQQRVAGDALRSADVVAISVHALCELAWVMGRVYGASRVDIAAAIRLFTRLDNVALDLPIIEAGLAFLDAGGDFADGVIAQSGAWLGGELLVSFDKKAVKLARAQGWSARALS